jgi:hypothetical protein
MRRRIVEEEILHRSNWFRGGSHLNGGTLGEEIIESELYLARREIATAFAFGTANLTPELQFQSSHEDFDDSKPN